MLTYRLAVIFLLSTSVLAQNLMKEKIRKIDARKKSIYLQRGIFYSGAKNIPSKLVRIRRSYRKDKEFERIVFDFNTQEPPRLYGHLSDSEKKLYMDFFTTTILPTVKFPEESRYVSSSHFLADNEILSVEVNLEVAKSAEIFHLSSPGRVVVDLKK